MRVSAVILAGGRGERLGHDKATLELGGATLVQRQIARLARLSDDLIVVSRPDQAFQVTQARHVTDAEPHAGVLAGMAAGLQAARHPWSLVVACDMPFLNLDLLGLMLASLEPPGDELWDIVVPALEVGLEPLHALYHRRCLAPLQRALATGRRRVTSFYAELRVRHMTLAEILPIDPVLRSFFNINTPEELAQARAWLPTEGPVAPG